jgi:hypothetical protein
VLLTCALTSALLVFDGTTAWALNCSIEQSIFPTSTGGFPWAFANGDAGSVRRVVNTFPTACGFQQNDYATNLVVNGNTGDYMEVGFQELGTSNIAHYYQIFTHLVVIGGDGQNGYNTCGSLSADWGYTQFRTYRIWANGWAFEVDCNATGAWTTVSNKLIDSSYTWGFPRSEFSRHTDETTFALNWTQLQYRFVNDGNWYNWPGFGCFFSPIDAQQLPGVDVRHLSSNSWDLVAGSGAC